jgi:MAF protein
MLVLASNSPRRKQLLALGGWSFKVLPTIVDERVHEAESPEAYVQRTAVSKAQTALHLLPAPVHPQTLIISADTAVIDTKSDSSQMRVVSKENSVVDKPRGKYIILGKPSDAIEAKSMLCRLRGKVHKVYTSLAVIQTSDGFMDTNMCITSVPMRDYGDVEIDEYVKTGDPLDKAGAYAIQHDGFNPVQNLQGCYANVMGLPLCHLTRTLKKFNVVPEVEIAAACQNALNYSCPVFQQILFPH